MGKVTAIRDRALQSRAAVDLVSDKWRITILHALGAGPLRNAELQRAMEWVSAKVLTQTLRGMERDGLIERRVFPVVPPHVEYELTPLAKSLTKPLRDLCHWAKAHEAEIEQARKAYELREEKAPPQRARA